MAEFNKIRFLLFVTLMVNSSHAVEMYLANVDVSFFYNTPINLFADGKYIERTVPGEVFTARNDTIKVIVYVCTLGIFKKIVRRKNRMERLLIAAELDQKKYELLFLGVKRPKVRDLKGIIGEFILETIKTKSQNESNIEILGYRSYHMQYQSSKNSYVVYNEDPYGILRGRLFAMGTKK